MRFTLPKFFGTALILGAASIPLQLLLAAKFSALASPTDVMSLFGQKAMGVLAALGMAKLAFEWSLLKHKSDPEMTPYRKAALLLSLPLGLLFRIRMTLAAVGTVVMPLMLALGGHTMEPQNIVVLSVLVFVMALGSELLERHLYFRASVPLKMPGGFAV
jgi:DMSO reductase anchor subunit